MTPAAGERLAYHPLLKIYPYGCLKRLRSSRRLEREAQPNIELKLLTGRLASDFKTIADFRRDNGAASPASADTLHTGAVVAVACGQVQSGEQSI
jgi:hypothetical protein